MSVLGSHDMVATVNNSSNNNNNHSNNKITNNKINNNKSKNINNNNNSISSGDMVSRVEEELRELARNNSRLARYIQMVNQVTEHNGRLVKVRETLEESIQKETGEVETLYKDKVKQLRD